VRNRLEPYARGESACCETGLGVRRAAAREGYLADGLGEAKLDEHADKDVVPNADTSATAGAVDEHVG